MPLPEIPWRVWEKTKKIVDKHTNLSCPLSAVWPDQSIFLLAENAQPDQLQNEFANDVKQHFAVADAALQNRFDAFGLQVGFDAEIDWQLDPVTKAGWPKRFWGDICFRDRSFGGVKFVWEYNRLYFLFSLGLCYRLSRDRRYADKICHIIRSWLAANPYPVGVNWASGIEAGVRLTNLVWALSFLADYDFAEKDLQDINCFVWQHARHLKRYPSRFSSANNHLLAEAFGLFVAGLYFPHLPGADKWLAQGRKVLEEEAGRQILQDGGSFEYSTTYLAFVLDFFLLYRHMCQVCGLSWGQMIDQRLQSACSFIDSIMDQDFHVPNIGDQDSAVLVGLGLTNEENFASVLNTAAVWFDQPGWATSKPDLKTWLICGQRPWEQQGKAKRKESVLHPQSGLAVIRDVVQEKELLLVGNAMPLGLPPLYAHGHLDALSFTLSLDGQEILVDPGTYLYHGGGKWREYFRSTAAHNTIRLDQKELSPQTGDFMFGRPYRILENRLQQEQARVVWSASHDAYQNKEPYAVLRREVAWQKQDRAIKIKDQVQPGQPALVELFFHLHPECTGDRIEGGFRLSRGSTRVDLFVDSRLQAEVFHGAESPLAGWYSPRFNEIYPCYTIRCQGRIEGEKTFVSSLQV